MAVIQGHANGCDVYTQNHRKKYINENFSDGMLNSN